MTPVPDHNGYPLNDGLAAWMARARARLLARPDLLGDADDAEIDRLIAQAERFDGSQWAGAMRCSKEHNAERIAAETGRSVEQARALLRVIFNAEGVTGWG